MRIILKMIFRGVARILILPLFLMYWITKLFNKQDTHIAGYSQFLSLFPGLLGQYLRREFYRLALRCCSKDCCISFGTVFSSNDVEIGENVYIGTYCIIGHVRLKNNVLLASRVSVLSGLRQHGAKELNIPIRDQQGIFEVVTIEEDCWIGEGAILAADIGAHSIVAAGSVVFEKLAPYSVAKGNPAQRVRDRREV